MIIGHIQWEAEYDRIVGEYRGIDKTTLTAEQIAEAEEKAIAELRKLHLTTGQAIAALTGMRRRG